MNGEARSMGFSARILLDSVSPGGVRLTTMEVRYPRFIHSELMTHRVFSRNSASSRAIPIRKMIDAVRAEPAMPMWWGRNQSGMQARDPLDPASQALAEVEWRKALDDALTHAERLAAKDINLHKQLVNRILEPFAWITVIITATEWANFFTQRTHEDAQPELRHIAELMLTAYRAGEPCALAHGEWHEFVLRAMCLFYLTHPKVYEQRLDRESAAVLAALDRVKAISGQPQAILARTGGAHGRRRLPASTGIWSAGG